MPYINGKFVSYEEEQKVLNNPSQLASLNPQEKEKPFQTGTEAGGFGMFSPEIRSFSGGFFEDYKPGFFGTDKYLPDTGLNRYTNFQELRAANQSAGTQLAFGAAKFVTTALTTALDGTVGSIIGLTSMVDGDEDTGFVNNPFSNTMQRWNEAMETVAPNYYTEYQQEHTDLTSANFWGDTVLKNAGFAVGAILPAMLTGGASLGALSSIGKKGIIRQLKNVGKLSDEAISQIARGEKTMESVIAGAQAESKLYKAFKLTSELVGSGTAALGEARLEALDTRKSTQEYLERTGEWETMSDEQRTNALDAASNNVFVSNLALLTASNFIQFHKLFSRGFDFNKKSLNVLGNLKEGYRKSGSNFMMHTGNILKPVLTEGLEEGTQYALQEAGKEYAINRINDPDSNNFLHTFLNESLNAVASASNGNKEFTESVLSGAIMGLVGIPFVKGGNIHSRYKETRDKIADRDKFIDKMNNSEVVKKFKDIGSQIETLKGLYSLTSEELTDEKAKEINTLKNGILTSLSYMMDAQKSLLNNDKQAYMSFQDQDFANVVFSMIETGKIEDLHELFDSALNIAPEELRALYSKEIKVKTEKGEKVETLDPSKHEQTIDLLNEHKARIEEKKKNLNTIAGIYDNIQTIANGQLTTEAARNLTISLYNNSKLDQRQKELAEKINQELNLEGISEDAGLVKDLEEFFGNYSEGAKAEIDSKVKSSLYKEGILKLVDDIQSSNKSTRDKAAEKLIKILGAKAIEETLSKPNSEGKVTTVKELASTIRDLNQIVGDRRVLSKHIAAALANPAQYSTKIHDIIYNNQLPEDYLEEYMPILKDIKDAKLSLASVEEAIEINKLNNDYAGFVNSLSTKKTSEEFHYPENSAHKLAKNMFSDEGNDTDQAPFEDWSSFLRSSGNQDPEVNIPGTSNYRWWRFMGEHFKNILNGTLGFTVITVDNINNMPEAFGNTITFFNPETGENTLRKDISDDQLELYRQDIKVIPYYKNRKNTPAVEIEGNIVFTSLRNPSLVKTSGKQKGEPVFSYKQWAIKNPEGTTEQLEAAKLEALEKYTQYREYLINKGKEGKFIPLFPRKINPGARVNNNQMNSLQGTILGTGEKLADFAQKNGLEILTISEVDEGQPTLTKEINGLNWKLALGSSYIVYEGVPYLLQEQLLKEVDVNNITELLKWLASNPSEENVKTITTYLSSLVNMYTKKNKEGNNTYQFYIKLNKKGLDHVVIGDKKITAQDLKDGKVDELKQFLKTKRYNISKTNRGKKYYSYSIVGGALKPTEVRSGYDQFILSDDRVKIRMSPIKRNEKNEIDYEHLTLNPIRPNRSIQFSATPVEPSIKPRKEAEEVLSAAVAEIAAEESSSTQNTVTTALKSRLDFNIDFFKLEVKELEAQIQAEKDIRLALKLELAAANTKLVNELQVKLSKIETQIKTLKSIKSGKNTNYTKNLNKEKERLHKELVQSLKTLDALQESIKVVENNINSLILIKRDTQKKIAYYNSIKDKKDFNVVAEINNLEKELSNVNKTLDSLNKILTHLRNLFKDILSSINSSINELDNFVLKVTGQRENYDALTKNAVSYSFFKFKQTLKFLEDNVDSNIELLEPTEKSIAENEAEVNKLTATAIKYQNEIRYLEELLLDNISILNASIKETVAKEVVKVKKEEAAKQAESVKTETTPPTAPPTVEILSQADQMTAWFSTVIPSNDLPSEDQLNEVVIPDDKQEAMDAWLKTSLPSEDEANEVVIPPSIITETSKEEIKNTTEPFVIGSKVKVINGTKGESVIVSFPKANHAKLEDTRLVRLSSIELIDTPSGINVPSITESVPDQVQNTKESILTNKKKDLSKLRRGKKPDAGEAPFRLFIEQPTEAVSSEELNWFSKAFKNAVIQPVFGLIDDVAVGQVITGTKVLISNLASSGIYFHEGFHLIENHLPEQSKAAYNSLRKRLGNKQVQVQSGKTFVTKAGKDLTDSEASEFLAFDFERFMLNPDEYKFPDKETKTFFDLIYDVVSRFLNYFGINIKNDPIEKLFEFAKKADNLTLSENLINNNREKIFKIANYDAASANILLKDFNVSFFKKLFYNEDFSLNVEKLYSYAELADPTFLYEELREELLEEWDTTTDENRKKVIGDFFFDQEDNEIWEEFIDAHKALLASYGLEDLVAEEEDDIEDPYTSGQTNDNSFEKGNTTDYRSHTPKTVRLLLASLPNITTDKVTTLKRYGDFGYYSTVEYDKLINALTFRLANTRSLSDMVEIMENMAKKPQFSHIGIIVNALNMKASIAPNIHTAKLRLDFEQHFRKSFNNVSKVNLGSSGVEILDAISDSMDIRLRTNWYNKATTLYTDDGLLGLSETKGVFIREKVLNDLTANKELTKAEKLDILKQLGIELPEEIGDISTEFVHIIADLKKQKEPSLEWLYSNRNKSFGRIKELAKKASAFIEEDVYLQFLNSEGKTEYAIGLYTNLGLTLESLAAGVVPAYLKPFDGIDGNPLAKYSKWIAQATNKKFNGKLTVSKGIQDKEKGVEYSKANKTDLILIVINGLLEGTSNFIRAADRTTEYGITTELELITTPNSTIYTLEYLEAFKGYLKGELLHTALFVTRNWNSKYTNWSKHALDWGSFDYLPKELMNQFVAKLKEDQEAVKGKEEEFIEKFLQDNNADIERKLIEDYEDSVAIMKDMFTTNNLAVQIGVGKYKIPGLLSHRVNAILGNPESTNTTITGDELRTLASALTLHDMISKQEQIIIAMGDVRHYKSPTDVPKRTALPTATRYVSISDDNTNAALDKFFRRYDGKKRSNVLSKVTMKSIKKPSKDNKLFDKIFGKKSPYSGNMDIADAQSYGTADAWLDFHFRSYNQLITTDVLKTVEYNQQLYFKRLYDKTISEPSKAGVDFKSVTWEEFKELFKEHLPSDVTPKTFKPHYKQKEITNYDIQNNLVNLAVVKPQGTGSAINSNGTFIPETIKTSTPFMSHLDYEEGSAMMNLLDWMVLNQVDIALFDSASKSDYVSEEVFNLVDGNVVFTKPAPSVISEYPWNDIGIQQIMESKSKKKTIFSSQYRALITVNHSNKQAVTEFTDLINLQIVKAKEELLENLGLSPNEKNVEVFKAKLTEIFKNKFVAIDQIDGLALALTEDNLNSFIDLLKDKPKIESIITSFFKNNIINKKVTGDNLVQVSNIGIGVDLKTYSIKGYAEVNGVDNYDEVKDNETTAAECIIPLPQHWWSWVIRNFETLENFNAQLATTDLIDQSILTIPANRIPNQGPNLIDVFRVKKFSHPILGSKIYLPEEHTTKTGSDYDVDKLLTYYNNTYFSNDDRIKMLEFISEKNDETFNIWLEQSKIKTFVDVTEDRYLKGYSTRLNSISEELSTFNKNVSKLLETQVFSYIAQLTGKKVTSIKEGKEAYKDAISEKQAEINAINEELGSNYVDNLEAITDRPDKKYIPDFKEKEAKRKKLVSEIHILVENIKNLNSSIVDIKQGQQTITEQENSILAAIATRKNNLKNSILEQQREIFDNTPLDKLNSLAQVENELNKRIIKILLSAENRYQLLNTTDNISGELTDLVEKPELHPKLQPYQDEFKKRTSKVNYSNLNKFWFSIDKSEENFVSLTGVGTTAVATVSHAVSQHSPVNVTDDKIMMFFEGIDQTPKGFKMGVVYSFDDQYISDSFNAFMSFFVDAPKNPGVFKTNVYGDLFSVYNFLKRHTNTGKTLDDKYLMLFFRQPIITEFIKRSSKNTSRWYKNQGLDGTNNEVVLKLLKDIGYPMGENFSLLHEKFTEKGGFYQTGFSDETLAELKKEVLTRKQLENTIGKAYDSPESKEIAGRILQHLLLYKDYAYNLEDLQKVTRPMSSFPNTRGGLKQIEILKDELIKKAFYTKESIENFINNTILKEFSSTANLASESMAPYFLTDKDLIKAKLYDHIRKLVLNKRNSNADIEKAINKVENFFINYIVHIGNTKVEDRIKSKYKQLLLPAIDGKPNPNNIAEKIKRARQNPEIANNPIIEALIPTVYKHTKVSNKISKIAAVEFLNKKYPTEKLNILHDGLRELYESPNAEYKQLAEDIATFMIMSTGLQYTPKSIQPAIINTIYFDLVKEPISNFLTKLEDPNTAWFEKFYSEFEQALIQNRPLDEDVVTVKTHKIKTKQGFWYPPAMTPNIIKSKKEQKEEWALVDSNIKAMFEIEHYQLMQFSSPDAFVGMTYYDTKDVDFGGGIRIQELTGSKENWLLLNTGIPVPNKPNSNLFIRINTKGEMNNFFEAGKPNELSIIANNNITTQNVILEKVVPISTVETSSQTTVNQEAVANIPQNKVSGIESFGSIVTANDEVIKALGPNPHSIDMIEAGFRTRTTRSENEMTKYAVKVGDVIKHFGKSADGTTKNILAKVTAIHPKGTPGFKGTWVKEGWRAEDVNVIDRFKNGAAAIEFEVISKPTQPSTNIKSGVSELFESNPELANIGTQQQYSQYLDTIFPDSKVKDIVYHGTNAGFDKFDLSFEGSNIKGGRGKGINFTRKLFDTDLYGDIKISVILNAQKLVQTDLEAKQITLSYIDDVDEIVVYNPEQIHILGSKQDIERFKKFVSQFKDGAVLSTKTANSKSDTEILNSPEFKLFHSQNPQTSLEDNLAYFKKCKIWIV